METFRSLLRRWGGRVCVPLRADPTGAVLVGGIVLAASFVYTIVLVGVL